MEGLSGFATRTEAVADRLRRAILAGEYEPGARLRQADIAAQLGVSTTPVREAFGILIPEGFLRGDAHRGVIVAEPDANDMRELYEMRIALEALATGKAAEKVTDADLVELEKLCAAMSTLATKKTHVALDEYHRLNLAFHSRIYAVAGLPRLAELILSLRTQSDAYQRMLPVRVLELGTTDAQHVAIVDGLRRRSPKRAEAAMRAHLRFNADHIAAQLEPPAEAAS